jgi:hypothetical protein
MKLSLSLQKININYRKEKKKKKKKQATTASKQEEYWSCHQRIVIPKEAILSRSRLVRRIY